MIWVMRKIMQRWDQVSWRSGGGGGVQASTGSQPGSGKVIPEVFWSRLRQGSRAGSPGIILPCYKLKRKPVKVVGEGMCPIHTDPSGSTFLPSFMLKTPDLSPSAQAWRDYGGGGRTHQWVLQLQGGDPGDVEQLCLLRAGGAVTSQR